MSSSSVTLFDAKAVAKAYLDRFSAIKTELKTKGCDETTATSLAMDATRRSFEQET